MADLDTREKRASGIHVGQPWRGLLPLPDAPAEDQGDRQQMAGLYRAILAGVVTAPTFFGDLTTLFCAYMADIRNNNPTRRDTETLIAHDLPAIRAAHPGDVDDANTLYAVHLS